MTVWLVKDDCGHDPLIFDTKRHAYDYVKKEVERYGTSQELEELEKDYDKHDGYFYGGDFIAWEYMVYTSGNLTTTED